MHAGVPPVSGLRSGLLGLLLAKSGAFVGRPLGRRFRRLLSLIGSGPEAKREEEPIGEPRGVVARDRSDTTTPLLPLSNRRFNRILFFVNTVDLIIGSRHVLPVLASFGSNVAHR